MIVHNFEVMHTLEILLNLEVTQVIWQKKLMRHQAFELPNGFLIDLARMDYLITQEDIED